MTSLIRDEFTVRQEDIDLLIELTKSLDEMNTSNYNAEYLDKNEKIKEINVSQRLIDVMKSALYLLAYNQTESTMRGCLADVYDEISDKGVSYDDLKAPIQEAVIRGLLKKYNGGGPSLVSNVSGKLSLNSPRASLDIKKVFNGNIETKTIHEMKKVYGVNVVKNESNRDGADITILKKARNDLAHGNKSFSHYTSSKDLSNVITEVNSSSNYLSAVITGFEQYVNNQEYKA